MIPKHAVIQLKDSANGFKVVGEIERRIYPAGSSGSHWYWCYYRGRRYQMFGGIRNPYFIDIRHAIPTRIETKVKALAYLRSLAR